MNLGVITTKNAESLKDHLFLHSFLHRFGVGQGFVYRDMKEKSTGEVLRFKTSSKEDKIMIKYMKQQVGKRIYYNLYGDSCRHYIHEEFDFLKDTIERKRK